ncbi:uncharacterized protein LOC118754552 [Rhagoletis pomonella]|uniref:uncharacterized protein LOC118754552 n=1 Tax=Rhagoletis pomonella TaxID=28610 RepID=UPI00177FDA73|nr:uncharacterized protein LOC118754552 [Rhagoletis pomonella]
MHMDSSNILDESFCEESPVEMGQSLIKKRCYDTNVEAAGVSQVCSPSDDINAKLDTNVEEEEAAGVSQVCSPSDDINAKLDILLNNQKAIWDTLQTSINNQAKLSTNQAELEKKFISLQMNAVENAEFLALAKSAREIKVSVQNIEKEVCRMTGEACDKIMNEIASMLPCSAYTPIMALEEKLKAKEYVKAMTTYLYKVKGVSDDVGGVFKKLFTDESLAEFNWEGRWEKKALRELTLFEHVLRDVFNKMTSKEFEHAVKKQVERSHHRLHQKKYDSKKSDKK